MINNFNLLHEVLRNIGLKFSPDVALNIMNKNPETILNLLYEIRSRLERKGVNPDNLSLKKCNTKFIFLIIS
jgi:hypothetical protein